MPSKRAQDSDSRSCPSTGYHRWCTGGTDRHQMEHPTNQIARFLPFSAAAVRLRSDLHISSEPLSGQIRSESGAFACVCADKGAWGPSSAPLSSPLLLSSHALLHLSCTALHRCACCPSSGRDWEAAGNPSTLWYKSKPQPTPGTKSTGGAAPRGQQLSTMRATSAAAASLAGVARGTTADGGGDGGGAP